MNERPRILIIDDDLGRNIKPTKRKDWCFRLGINDITESNKGADRFAHNKNYKVEPIGNPICDGVFISGQSLVENSYENVLDETIEFLERTAKDIPTWSLILLDLRFNTGKESENGDVPGRRNDADPQHYFGLQILRKIFVNSLLNRIPVVVLSSMERDPIEHEFAENMARAFVSKNDLSKDKLIELIETHGLIPDDNNELTERIIGNSMPLMECLREARAAARSGNSNVLVIGESGTGKELIAKYIHRKAHAYGRANKYKAFFASAVSKELIDSDLFGYDKGTFTNQLPEGKIGIAENADGGTLFIDEAGDLPDEVKVKLYRLLEDHTREIRKQGGTLSKKLDLLIILATEKEDIRNSEKERTSFLRRINAKRAIILPPLRERKEDILLLTDYFIKKHTDTFNKKNSSKLVYKKLSNEAKNWIVNEYDWKDGNISLLEKTLEHIIDSFPDIRIISINHFSSSLKLDELNNSSQVRPEKYEKNNVDNLFTENEEKITLENFEEITLDRLQLNEILQRSQATYYTKNAIYLVKGLIANIKPNGDFNYTGTIRLLFDKDISPTNANRVIKYLTDKKTLDSLLSYSPKEITRSAIKFLIDKIS